MPQKKQAPKPARQTDRNYRDFFRSAPIGLFTTTPDGRFLDANPALARMLGYETPEELMDSVTDIGTQIYADPEVRNRATRLLAENGEILNFECRVARRDGTVFWASQCTRVVRDGKGRIRHFQGFLTDITERKQMETESAFRNALLSAQQEASIDGILAVDGEGKIILHNQRFADIWKIPPDIVATKSDELMLQSVRRWLVEPEAFLEKVKYLYDHRQESIQDEIPLNDGRVLERYSSPLTGVDNQYFGRVWFFRDITERKRAEQELKESETRYSTFINSTADFVFLKDNHFQHIVANKALADFYGRTPEEIIGLSDFDLMPEEAAQNCRASDREAVTTGSVVSSEEAVGDRVFETTKFPVPLQNGKTGVGGFIRDVTERKRAVEERRELEEQLQRAEKMEALGLLAGGVAHDLNNILGVMVGYSELLAEKLPEGTPTRRHADNILQASIRGAAIIQDLLTLARRGVNVSDVVDLGGILSDYLGTQEFREMRDRHPQVAFAAELESRLLNIKGSPVHLSKTVMNLVSNAFESIAGRGEVTIRTENRYLDQPIRGYDDVREGDYVVLTVSDTGGGISAEDLGKIFEPFYTKKVMGRSGTGLGLAVVWGTVKDHSGYIDVQSAEGEGSTFTLYFPVTREKSARDDMDASPASCRGRGESILVVDDVKEQRELAISMLEKLGYRVEAVAGGEEAVALLRSRKADLVVLDMIMDPGIDGMETYRRILEIHPRQKAILASGFSETDRVRKTLEMGAGAFVQKPYILEKIGLAVRTELDRK
ncbi:MAG: PAS domain S-box protein [Syntrophales bacterium]